VAFRKRDPEAFKRLGVRAVSNYKRLGQEWDRLVEEYRAALDELTSADSWKQVFDPK
jgi:galactofuranosylgalactofuranosylrhamnosyl-N-acetylglucosaminyl-diphospho-decaprenol beta-1,5/1,6-galactofuranosyltransferase